MSYLKLDDPAVANMENARRMQMIIRELKEIPELPSETPKDSTGLDRVEFPPQGGVLTFMTGHEYPYRGFPFYEFVEKIDSIKKLSRGILSGLFHELKSVNKIWLVTLLPALWFFKPLVYSAIYSFHRFIVRSRVKPEKYSNAIRELYQAFNYDDGTEDGKTRLLRGWLKDILCMILEYDNAYRFRFQDAMEELDKELLKKDPVKELDRLLTSMQERELGQDIKDTWVLLQLFCGYYLRIDGRMRSILVSVLSRLDVKNVLLTPEDKYFCAHRKDFVPRYLKGLRELKPSELGDRKEDWIITEKAYIAKEVNEESTMLTDKYNTERADLINTYNAEKERLEKLGQPIETLTADLKSEGALLDAKFSALFEKNKTAYKDRVAELTKTL